MAKQLELRRGTTQANNLFTGATGEVTMDTDTKQLRVHDGVKTGGYAIDTLVAFQAPNAGNNYTWYRKYASGWVEQGGVFTVSVSSRFGYATITLLVTMDNINYTVYAQGGYITNVSAMAYNVNSKTVNNFIVQAIAVDGTSASGTPNQGSWYVCGMAA